MEKFDSKKYFEENGYIVVTDVLSKEICNFLTRFLYLTAHVSHLKKIKADDQQVPHSLLSIGHETVFDTVSEMIWPKIESITGLELIPTYCYSRLLKNGNDLKKHKDRPSCEISITIQLGRSHHYAWPIYMGGKRVDLAEGSAVIYKGCEVEHWREECDGPDGYYSGQLFCHYVKADGEYADHAGDKRFRNGKHPFVRHRTYLMDNK